MAKGMRIWQIPPSVCVCGLVALCRSLSHKNGLEHIWPTWTGQPEEGALLLGEKACQAFVSGQREAADCVSLSVAFFLSACQGSV